MRSRWVLALAMASLFSLPSAQAEATAQTNIAGRWSFTADIELDCTFGGTAVLENTGDGRYTGELTARQSCPMLEDDYLVRQDCTASVLGNQVSVRCTIVEFINGFSSPFYYPDNFTLTIGSPDRMHGALVSSGTANPAEWRRAEGGIS